MRRSFELRKLCLPRVCRQSSSTATKSPQKTSSQVISTAPTARSEAKSASGPSSPSSSSSLLSSSPSQRTKLSDSSPAPSPAPSPTPPQSPSPRRSLRRTSSPPLTLQHFLLRARARALYRSILRITSFSTSPSSGPTDAGERSLDTNLKAEMRTYARCEFESRRHETDLVRIKYLISMGKKEVERLSGQVALSASAHGSSQGRSGDEG